MALDRFEKDGLCWLAALALILLLAWAAIELASIWWGMRDGL